MRFNCVFFIACSLFVLGAPNSNVITNHTIAGVGFFYHSEAGVVLDVKISEGELVIKVRHRKGNGVVVESSVVEGWFVYIENRSKVWIYGGGGVLFMSAEADSGFQFEGLYEFSTECDLLPVRPPKSVIEMLPEKLNEKVSTADWSSRKR